jgi:hypothetical protein
MWHEAAVTDGGQLMRWINSEIRDRQPWKISIAEDSAVILSQDQ